MHILLVEDDTAMHTSLQRALTRRGMHVQWVGDGAQALAQWKSQAPDAVVLDLSLPSMDGLDVLANARAFGLNTPVLILTARGTVGDRVLGLNAGADDYLPKPFDLEELFARLQALLRRSSNHAVQPGLPDNNFDQLGGLRCERDTGAIYWQGEPMELPPRERMLLQMLLSKPGQAVPKERLYTHVFADEDRAQPEAIEVVVYRLRKKLQDKGVELVTLRGLGYLLKLTAPASGSVAP